MLEITDSSLDLNALDRLMMIVFIAIVIAGYYQIYFLPQRHQLKKAKSFETQFDSFIKYNPRWVWVYSGLYYPAILIIGLFVPSWVQLIYAIMNGGALLLLHCLIFFLMPVEVPENWRTPNYPGISQKALNFVQGIDQRSNSFPSMHVSVAMLVALYIHKYVPGIYPVAMFFPVLISISALKTKQHFVVDILPGCATGFSTFYLWEYLFSFV